MSDISYRLYLLQPETHRAILRSLCERGTARVVGTGRCMVPTVMPGDHVRVRAAKNIRAGDVVLFAGLGDSLVLHRVLAAVPKLSLFVHAGDSKGAQPGIARMTRVIGRADLPRRRIPLRTWWTVARRGARAAGRLAISVMR